ncbi:methyltransferase domain-containing protein [Haloactinopolyspora alba]|uniref:methyltransferase domain-containing protein n=1 Tax=Haloactinopolyspora alba TaxID=648780 RepID=UPI000D0CF147|nr:methyltransferase domain-containing protein [Haloactinopolyspora alba]
MGHDVSGVAAAFDARAGTYARSDWHVRYAERLVELAAPSPGMHVLDAATGTGFAALAAARAVGPTGRVVGVDVAAGMLDHARRAAVAAGLGSLELVRTDATDPAGSAASSRSPPCGRAIPHPRGCSGSTPRVTG